MPEPVTPHIPVDTWQRSIALGRADEAIDLLWMTCRRVTHRVEKLEDLPDKIRESIIVSLNNAQTCITEDDQWLRYKINPDL